MTTASLENCKELYEVSGWLVPNMENHSQAKDHRVVPAYDLGYLLRKLPQEATSKKRGGYHYLYLHHGKQDWYAYYGEIDTTEFMASGDTPEDAACKLAIELFKQGVLTK